LGQDAVENDDKDRRNEGVKRQNPCFCAIGLAACCSVGYPGWLAPPDP
jgi:hypothetical protein